eukprot:TRINITY_DN5281_c1_g2_i1.p1 TRINITY_DN5281_c1_g2~~TRINITY_DN5281_c1_g2_i1.p1  ORF type:complete len:673 (+),score=237.19 TRINITY_DN5281_c1_g2_i1:110-2128(+)
MEKYRQVRQIGRGAQGTATLVQSERDGRFYVMKSVNVLSLNQQDRDRAQRECSILVRLRHPHIIKYVESITSGGVQLIVMEWAAGGTLEDHIIERRRSGAGPFPQSTVLRWFGQLCRALHYCHENKVLHRDIKSSNLFLSADRQDILLGDFGIAKELDSTMAVARTSVGSPMGMSPEAIRGHPYSCASDLWSLGCVLHEMCALQHPFRSANIGELVNKVLHQPLPELPQSAGPLLRRLGATLLERKPQDRMQLAAILQIPEVHHAAAASPPNALPGAAPEGAADGEDTEEWAARFSAQLRVISDYLDSVRQSDAEFLAAQGVLQKPPTPDMPRDRLRRAGDRQAQLQAGGRPASAQLADPQQHQQQRRRREAKPAPKPAPPPAAPANAKEAKRLVEAELEQKRQRIREEKEERKVRERQQEAERDCQRRANADQRRHAGEQRRMAAPVAPARAAGPSAAQPSRLALEQADLAAKRDRIMKEKEEKRKEKAEQEQRLEEERQRNAQMRREAAQLRRQHIGAEEPPMVAAAAPGPPPRPAPLGVPRLSPGSPPAQPGGRVRGDRPPIASPAEEHSPKCGRESFASSVRSLGGYSSTDRPGGLGQSRRRTPQGDGARGPASEGRPDLDDRRQQRQAAQQELREQLAAARRAAARSRTPADGPSIELCLQNFGTPT